ENDISYEKKDKIKPGLKKKVKEDMEISITKVKKEEEKEEESIPFETEEEEDSSLEKGKTETKQEGKEGTVVKTYEVTYENGKEKYEKVVEEEQNEIIAVGTKEEPKPEPKKEKKSEEKSGTKSEEKSEQKAEPTKSSADSSDDSSSSESSSGGKEMTMEATAYGPDCSGCSGVSATGMNLKDSSAKVIAVDPSVIPLGSRIWVEGYGEAVAGDTGGAIKGNRIDVLYPSESEAGSWGRKSVNVKVLD